MANSWQSKRIIGLPGKPQFSSLPSFAASGAGRIIPIDGLYTYTGQQFLSDFGIDISTWPLAVDIGNVPGSVKAVRALHSNDAPIISSIVAWTGAPGALANVQTWWRIQSFTNIGGTPYEGPPDTPPTPAGSLFGTVPTYPSFVVSNGGATINWPHAYGVNNRAGQTTAGYHLFRGTSNGFTTAVARYTILANGFVGDDPRYPITTALSYTDTGLASDGGSLLLNTGTPGNPGWPPVCFFSGVGQGGYGSPVSIPQGGDPTRWWSYGKIIGVDNSTPFMLIACGTDPRPASPTYGQYFNPNSDWPSHNCPYPPNPYELNPLCAAAPYYGECDSVGPDRPTPYPPYPFADDPNFWRCPNDAAFWASRDYVQAGFRMTDGYEELPTYHDRHIFIYNKDTNELACIIGASGHGYGWTSDIVDPKRPFVGPRLAMGTGAMFNGNPGIWNNPKHPQSHHRSRGSGASNLPEPAGCTSWEEIFTSPYAIPHGHLMNVNRSRGNWFGDIGGRAYCYPASGCDGTGGPNLPPIGSRFIMKSTQRLWDENHVDLRPGTTTYSPWLLKYFASYQTYGFIICDSLFFGAFVSRGQFIPSFIGNTEWNRVGGPYNQTSDKQLGDEWFWLCRADATIGNGLNGLPLVPVGMQPIDITCFEMTQLGLGQPFTTSGIGQGAPVLFDPHPG